MSSFTQRSSRRSFLQNAAIVGAVAAIGTSFSRQAAAAEPNFTPDIDIDPYQPYVYDRVSDAEFARRHRAIRQFMQQENLDCLLIAGGTGTWDRNWTNTRWAVNHVGAQLTNYSYVVFPLEGEPSVLAFPIVAWLPARRAREIVDDVRPTTDPAQTAVERINELGLAKGRIGIVETDLYTSIPHVHHQTFTQELPGVDWQTVTRQWWRALRLVRSDEEIAFIERSARIGDVMTAALADVLQPGISEQALFGTLYDAMARAGGETPAMVLAASGPSYSDFDIFQRERHMNRVLGVGDVVVTELGPRYPDGSECQTGRAYALGRPSRRYQEMGAVMLDAYDRVVDTFRPGKTDADVVKAAGVIKDAGYTWLSPLVHAPEGGATGALPHIASGVDQPEEKRVTFAPNMVMCVQIHVGLPDYSAGVFMADTWAITEKDPRCLNQYPREFIIVS